MNFRDFPALLTPMGNRVTLPRGSATPAHMTDFAQLVPQTSGSSSLPTKDQHILQISRMFCKFLRKHILQLGQIIWLSVQDVNL
jgi:hypothetical protein